MKNKSKNSMRVYAFLFSIIFFLTLSVSEVAFAEGIPPHSVNYLSTDGKTPTSVIPDIPIGEGSMIADISLTDVRILSRDEQDVVIVFLLVNHGKESQAGIRYRVEAIGQGVSGGKIVSDEILELLPKQAVNKKLGFSTASLPAGEYSFRVIAYLQDGYEGDGLMLAFGETGIIPVSPVAAVSQEPDLNGRGENGSETSSDDTVIVSGIIIAGALFMLGLFVIVFRKKIFNGRYISGFILISFISFGVLAFTGKASALTWQPSSILGVPWSSIPPCPAAPSVTCINGFQIYTVNTDKSVYAPGETVVLSGSVYNVWYYYVPQPAWSNTNGYIQASFGSVTSFGGLTNGWSNPPTPMTWSDASAFVVGGKIQPNVTGVTISGSSTLAAPMTPGVHKINLCGQYGQPYGCVAASIDITVSATPTFSCAGFIPANASVYSGDDLGLSMVTPYVYSVMDTAAKCEYSCNAGYVLNGMFCDIAPVTPTIDLKVNGSDGPVTLASGAAKNLSWTATNTTSCTASGVDAFTGSKGVPNGSETLTVSRTSTDMLTCTGPGGTASDSVQINATCTPSTGAWGACDCSTETKTRTNINASCLPWTESNVCTIDEKNGCRDFNWKEVAP